jgi:hypothetical protein
MKIVEKLRALKHAKQSKKSLKENREALVALVRRLRDGEIGAFYYGPLNDPGYKHSLLVERITEKGENGKTTYEYTWTKEIGEGGRIRITGYDVSAPSCATAAINLERYHTARGHYLADFHTTFKWREINHDKENKQ